MNVILDLIFTNLSRFYDTPKILPGIGLSDHNSIVTRSFIPVQKIKAEKVFRRTMKQSSKVSFGWLSGTDWCFMGMLPNCTEKVNTFNSLLHFAINKFSPVRSHKQYPTDKPWITLELKIHKEQRQKGMLKDPTTFKRLRNKANNLNNRLRSSFFEKKVENCGNSVQWWRSITKLT